MIPNIYIADEIKKMNDMVHTGNPDDGWKLARPLGLFGIGLGVRLKHSWLVFTGQADCLIWWSKK